MSSPASDSVRSLVGLHVEDLLFPVLVQLIVIIGVARAFGALARKLRHPAVVGEVLGGLLLGPSLFGWLFPEVSAAIFQPRLPGVPDELAHAAFPKIFQVLSQIGLIFLLFLIGLEFDFEHLKVKGTAAAAVAVAGILLPFALGAATAPLVHPVLEPHPTAGPVPLYGLTLFLGVALSVTALPTLGRILIEMGITRTRVGTVALTAAAADDVIVWVLLAAVGSLTKSGGSEFSWTGPATMLAQTVGFAAVLLAGVRPVLGRYLDRKMRTNSGQLAVTPLAVLMVSLLACGVVTNRIGISAVFGAFLLGAALSGRHELRHAVVNRLRDVVTSFFLPIFFTYSGLRTDVGSLGGLWWMAGVIVLAGVVGKFGGCTVAARVSGFGWREAAQVGVMMNTRALMALIVINVGYDMGVVPKSLFCALVILAVVTTVITCPVLLRLRHGTELDGAIRTSGFVRH